jgi:inorganic pyrophosphatase
MAKKNGLADPSQLKPHDSDDKQLLRVVIETPKGSRNTFAFNSDEHIFELKTVLPSGMTFPYDFGFVPSTKADDGDPVDVLVRMDEPAFPGCVLKCRPIGVIEGEQGNKKKKSGNDRIVAIEGLADVRIVEAAYESARTGKTVRLPDLPEKKRPTVQQEIRRPAHGKPKTIDTKSPSGEAA